MNNFTVALHNKRPLVELDANLHEAVERADISTIMKCLDEGAEVRIASEAYKSN